MTDETTAVGMERKLAAIFSTDVAGYSRLMGDNEEATIRTLTAYRAVLSSFIQQYRGRVIDSPGDNLLAEFASVVDAVRCAVEIQQQLKVKNAELPEHRQMQFRIGINLGDVIVEGERLYGDGVNIAARLESLAIPGGICISGSVYEQVKNKGALAYEDIGPQVVKNIADPVRVFRVRTEETESSKFKVQSSTSKRENRRTGFAPRKGVIGAASLLLITGAIATRFLFFPTPNPQPLAPNTQAAPAALPLPDKPSIVVLPFDNMSKDPEQDYFSNGITEVLTSDLSRLSSLFVIARNTAFTYKGKAVNMRDLRNELGVRYVLEGSVQKANEQVRIVTQLIDTTTDSHLWAERYDRPYKDIFAIQDEIVRKIVTTLKLQLSLQEQGFRVRKATDNLEAYDYFLRGVEQSYRYTKEANEGAREMFGKAVALDPQYAEAYARQGRTYFLEWIWGWNVTPQTLRQAFALARQALTLDDSSPFVHSVLGWGLALNQQYDQAVVESERAIALDPNNDESYARQAEVLIMAGKPDAALHSIEKAMRFNPRYPAWYLHELGTVYLWDGKSEEAVAVLKEALIRVPNHLGALINLGSSLLFQWISQRADVQALGEALAVTQRAVALNDSFSASHWILGMVYFSQKQYEQAIAESERTIALSPEWTDGYAALALALSGAGKVEEARTVAEQALRRKSRFYVDAHLIIIGIADVLAGQPDKAVAPLQQYRSRFPNILYAHVFLTAAYSELGKDTEARAEVAEVLRINPNFSLEVHKERMPIKDPAVLERHIAALRKAGLK